MTRFTRKPPAPSTVQDFIAAADAPPAAQPAAEPAPRTPSRPAERRPVDKTRPWARHRRKAKPTKNFTLRLNEYELALLRHVTEQASAQTEEDLSMQQVCKQLLIPALEERAGVATDS